jgi:hypothetical protein
MNELELQLRSWAPRPPSAKLSQKLFPQPQAESASGSAEHETRSPEALLSFRWLVPATAALLLVCLVLNQHNTPPLTGGVRREPMVAMIMSNQSAISYLPGTFQREQNILLADTFEWTNGSGSTSSISSLSPTKGSN